MADEIEKIKVSELQSAGTLSGLDTLGVLSGNSVKARIDTFVYNTVASAVSNRPTTTEMNSAIASAVSDKPTTTQMNAAIASAVENRPTTTDMSTAIGNATADALFLGDIIESNVTIAGL